jgi:hypothetical protein
MVYAVAHRGIRLLHELGMEYRSAECTSEKRERLDARSSSTSSRSSISMLHSSLRREVGATFALSTQTELVTTFPDATHDLRNPLAMRVTLDNAGTAHQVGLIPDLIFGLGFRDGSRCF